MSQARTTQAKSIARIVCEVSARLAITNAKLTLRTPAGQTAVLESQLIHSKNLSLERSMTRVNIWWWNACRWRGACSLVADARCDALDAWWCSVHGGYPGKNP